MTNLEAYNGKTKENLGAHDDHSFRLIVGKKDDLRTESCRSASKSPLIKASFFCPTPFLQLAFVLNSIGNPVKPLGIDQGHGTAGRGVAAERTGIVLSDSDLERSARGPDIITPVGTAKDVKKGNVGHVCPLAAHPTSS